MTLNDLAFIYYVGLLTQIIYCTIVGFMVPSGKTETRWKILEEGGKEHGFPAAIGIFLIYITALWWPIILVRKVIKLLRHLTK